MSEEKNTEADETVSEKTGQPPKKDLRQAMAAAGSALTLQWDEELLAELDKRNRAIRSGKEEPKETDPQP